MTVSRYCDFRPTMCEFSVEPWRRRCTSKSQIQRFQNVSLRPENVGFRHPLMFLQEILTYPTRTFHVHLDHLPQILWRASTSIAHYGFRVNPHTHREFRSHPLFFVPSFHLVHYCHHSRESSLGNGWCSWRFFTSAAVFDLTCCPARNSGEHTFASSWLCFAFLDKATSCQSLLTSNLF